MPACALPATFLLPDSCTQICRCMLRCAIPAPLDMCACPPPCQDFELCGHLVPKGTRMQCSLVQPLQTDERCAILGCISPAVQPDPRYAMPLELRLCKAALLSLNCVA